MNSELIGKILNDEEKVADAINRIRIGFCCVTTSKLSRSLEKPDIIELDVDKEVEFIINRFSYALNKTYIGYWKFYAVTVDGVWFEYVHWLPNMTNISTYVIDYTNYINEYIKVYVS